MRRALAISGLLLLATGMALGTAGTVAGQLGQTGYDDTEVQGEEVALPEGAQVFTVDLSDEGAADETFGDDVPPGAYLDVVAGGFGPETKGTIELTSEPRILAFVTADEDGVMRQRVQVPDDVDFGAHTLHVIGVDPDGNPRDVSIRLTVALAGDGGSNWPAWTAGSIAAALAVIGFARWRMTRRAAARSARSARSGSSSALLP